MSAKVETSGLDESLLHLIYMRVSQINGCAYCLDKHSKDARSVGETEQRLYALSAWRETPFFSPRERAALALAEAITTIATAHPSDELFAEAGEHFDEKELALVVWAATTMNTLNRVAITARLDVGGYQPKGT